jgi:hypothetical protein
MWKVKRWEGAAEHINEQRKSHDAEPNRHAENEDMDRWFSSLLAVLEVTNTTFNQCKGQVQAPGACL